MGELGTIHAKKFSKKKKSAHPRGPNGFLNSWGYLFQNKKLFLLLDFSIPFKMLQEKFRGLVSEHLVDVFPAICRHSSAVEQRFCKPLVVGSNPTAGSTPNCPEGQMNKSSVGNHTKKLKIITRTYLPNIYPTKKKSPLHLALRNSALKRPTSPKRAVLWMRFG